MPPSTIIVMDDATSVSSNVIQDRLLAWTGSYKMWRNDINQIFIVFTDEDSRNSAMTEMKKFGARKATQNDSFNANNAMKKKNMQKRKKRLKQQQ
eukprot:320732_1